MISRIGHAFVMALAGAAALGFGTSPSAAGGSLGYSYGSIALSCENGRLYPLRVGAVSDVGEIVTGHLMVGRGAVHMRLVPMGDGYRYAGRGIWFDGKRDTAVLFFGSYNAINCSIVREEAAIAVKG